MNQLEESGYHAHPVSLGGLISKLWGRKTPEVIRWMKNNINQTDDIFMMVTGIIRAGMIEKEVVEFIRGEVDDIARD